MGLYVFVSALRTVFSGSFQLLILGCLENVGRIIHFFFLSLPIVHKIKVVLLCKSNTIIAYADV